MSSGRGRIRDHDVLVRRDVPLCSNSARKAEVFGEEVVRDINQVNGASHEVAQTGPLVLHLASALLAAPSRSLGLTFLRDNGRRLSGRSLRVRHG